MHCRICHTQNPNGAVTCRACGVPLSQPEPAIIARPLPVEPPAGAGNAPPLPAGTRLRDGLFATGRVLRHSSFGFGYLGSDATARQPVTVYELCLAGSQRHNLHLEPGENCDEETLARAQQSFLEEGHLLSRLSHPGVEGIVATFAENNTIYRVAEHVRGRNALQLLQEKKQLSEEESITIVNSAGDALVAIHDADILHGSVCPEIIVIAGERTVLTGLGAGIAHEPAIAALLNQKADGYEYAAPAAGKSLDVRDDVYALAATLYHLLTGQPPTPARERGGDAELMEANWLNPRLSRQVSQAVMAALSIAPEARPSTVRAFLDSLIKPAATSIPNIRRGTSEAITPAPEVPKVETPKVETPKAETPKIEIPKPRRVIHPFGTGQTPRVRLRLQGQESEVLAIAFSRDNSEIMSFGTGHDVHIWSTRAGALMQTVLLQPPAPRRGKKRDEPGREGLHCAAIAPDGDMVACGYEGGLVRVWELPSGEVRHTLTGQAGRVNDLKFSSDGVWLASGSNDSTTMVWETEEGEEQQTMSEESDGVRVLAFSHDDRWLATGGDSGAIRLWNAWTSDLAWQQDGHEFWATSLAFAANGKVLASGSYDRTIRIWSIDSGKPLKALSGHEGCVAALAFHPDGSTLASAGLDATIRIWHAPSGQVKHTLSGHDDAVRCIVFSPDGSTLASAAGSEIRLWQAG